MLRPGNPCVLLLILASALAGCATRPADCDPSNTDASVIAKAGCLYSGSYDKRVASKQLQLQDAQKLNRMFRQTYAALQQQTRQVSGELKQQQASLDQVQQSVENLVQAIRDKAGDNQQVQRQITAVQDQLQTMQQTAATARATNTPVSILQQRQQMAELQVRVQDLEASLGLQ